MPALLSSLELCALHFHSSDKKGVAFMDPTSLPQGNSLREKDTSSPRLGICPPSHGKTMIKKTVGETVFLKEISVQVFPKRGSLLIGVHLFSEKKTFVPLQQKKTTNRSSMLCNFLHTDHHFFFFLHLSELRFPLALL